MRLLTNSNMIYTKLGNSALIRGTDLLLSRLARFQCDQPVHHTDLDTGVFLSMRGASAGTVSDKYFLEICPSADYLVEVLDGRSLNLDMYSQRGIPRFDPKGSEITTNTDKVWAFNKFVLKGQHLTVKVDGTTRRLLLPIRALITNTNTRVVRARMASLPDGITVFRPLRMVEEGLKRDAFGEMVSLFGKVMGDEHPETNYPRITSRTHREMNDRDTSVNILFLVNDTETIKPVYVHEAMKQLKTLECHGLHQFIARHLTAIKYTLGVSDEDMKYCSLTLVKYKKAGGLVAHIDGLENFLNSFGPILTIAMANRPKQFDLIPFFTAEPAPPVRITTKQHEIILMQGCARSAYAHAIPYGSDQENYTIAIKFPALRELCGTTLDEPYKCSVFDGDIPVVKLRPPPTHPDMPRE